MHGEAWFDRTGSYRWRLTRAWAEGPRVVFVMLNPNRADAERDDPTIRRCVGFARSWGYAGLEVVNLFGWRCRDPRELRQVPDPVGSDNDRVVDEVVARSAAVVVAWGNHGALFGRDQQVLARLPAPACLGITRIGQPIHPLYVPASRQPEPWRRAPGPEPAR